MSAITQQMHKALKTFEKSDDIDALFCIEEDTTHFTLVCTTRLPMQQAWDYVQNEILVSMRLSRVTFEPMLGCYDLRAKFLVEFDPEAR